MPNGGTLKLRSYVRDEWLCLDIADSGDGVPEAMPVFEWGVTDKPNGSGIGLAIVREIVQQHRGTVSYTTEHGKGITFHLKFPIHAGYTLEWPVRTATGFKTSSLLEPSD
jgi:signal transduction histidine kinase